MLAHVGTDALVAMAVVTTVLSAAAETIVDCLKGLHRVLRTMTNRSSRLSGFAPARQSAAPLHPTLLESDSAPSEPSVVSRFLRANKRKLIAIMHFAESLTPIALCIKP